MSRWIRGGLVALSLMCLSLPARAGLIHQYDLQNSYADALGGPALAPNGGSLAGGGGYQFDANQGLSLDGALPGPDVYSIAIDFSFARLDGYRRIVDFKDLQSDTGLYNLDQSLNFYNIITGPQVFATDTLARLVLTRDAAGMVNGYLNGVLQISFDDSSTQLATFTGTDNRIWFFQDDVAVPGEASAGFVNFIQIYDTALSADEVRALGGPTASAVPEPATWLLATGAGLALVAIRARDRRRARA